MAGPGIIESFLFLFDSDASKVEKESDRAGKAVESLSERINLGHGLSVKLGEALHDNVTELVGVVAGFFALREVMRQVFDTEEYAAHLKQVSDQLGIGVEALSTWGTAAKIVGGNADEFNGTLERLNGNLQQIDVTGKSRIAPFFEALHISLDGTNGKAKTALELYGDLNKAFQNMPKAESTGIGRRLQLDEGTIRLLQLTTKEFTELMAKSKEYGAITEAQADSAEKFERQLEWTGVLLRSIGADIGPWIVEPLDDLLEGLQRVLMALRELPAWIERNQAAIKDFGITMGIVAAILFWQALPAIIAMTAEMFEFAAGVLVATWPILVIIAAIAALFFLLNDLHTYMTGKGHSFFGSAWSSTAADVRLLIADIKTLWGWLQALDASGIWLLKGAVGLAKSAVSGFQSASEKAGHAGQKYGPEQFYPTVPISGMSSAAISNSSSKNATNTVNIGKVDVNTQATDAEGISKGISKGIVDQTHQALTNMDDGVKG